MNELRINGDRLWQSLIEMARIGGTQKGGVCRLALSEEDMQARDLLTKCCEELGMEVRFDAMGNQFARYPGNDPTAQPILIGSHLDSQPTGGKYDGTLGVLAALEVVRTIHESGNRPEHPIELVNWTNEEGARFTPAMIGSGVFAGAFDLTMAYDIKDKEGISIKEALNALGYLGDDTERTAYHASLELHIEQGPVLEQKALDAGVVTGVQGMRWYECRVPGKPAHAGTTPMEMRQDPVQTAIALIQDGYETVLKDPEAKITIGTITTQPQSINTVPEAVIFNLDLRHPESTGLDQMEARLKNRIKEYSKPGSEIELTEIWDSPPVVFHQACTEAVTEACKRLGTDYTPIMSGAGHDSVYLNRVMPAGMIFIPCKDGLSHNEAESITKEQAIAGANVLLQSVINLDTQPEISFHEKLAHHEL